MRIAITQVPCPLCKAAVGDPCRYIYHAAWLGQAMSYGHLPRKHDAATAEQMANTLLDE